MQNEPAYARHALGAGALGYVLKESAESELVEAIRRAALGDAYLNPRLGARVAAEPPPGLPDGLTQREVEVLRMIALGNTNAEIAEHLYLSVRTVETHRAHIQQKLRLGSRSELVATRSTTSSSTSSETGTTGDLPRCPACDDVLGVYEPIMHVT